LASSFCGGTEAESKTMRSKLVVGNWKMNGSLEANRSLVAALASGLAQAAAGRVEVALCPPSAYLTNVQELFSQFACVQAQSVAMYLGAQDVSRHTAGAFTGEVSAAMLRDLGVRFVIVGHSERRAQHGEHNEIVSLKSKAALAAGLTPIVCLGETLAERQAGKTMEVVKRQLAAVIHDNGHCISEVCVAYEPVWAIGTGQVATPEQAQEVHAVVRAQLRAASVAAADRVRILYGGSMNAANAASLLAQPDIDGGLIGGASLKADEFLKIIDAARALS
jgi:triosephosphate isomerase (TIM)